VSKSAEQLMESYRLRETEAANRKRLAELQADAYGLAFRFARDGSGTVGAELVLALKECLQACEALVGDLIIASRRERGWDGLTPRAEHESWLRSLRTTLLERAADVHREAELARRANNTPAVRRLFESKNRFELVAAALGDLIARSKNIGG
jgi:hypothetical protein